MSQQLLDMIMRMGGADAVSAMAARVGISPEQAQSAMAALAPAIAGGMAQQVQAGNQDAVNAAAGTAAAMTSSAASDEAVDHGSNILGQIFGGQDTTSAVAQAAAAKTGIDPGQLSALMPMIATMAASALGNGAGGAAAPVTGGGSSGGLGGLLGGLLGGGAAGAGGAGTGGAAGLLGMLDLNKDGNPLDDIMGLAQRFLKR